MIPHNNLVNLVHPYVWMVLPYVPSGGLYRLGRNITCPLLKAYLGIPTFFVELMRRVP